MLRFGLPTVPAEVSVFALNFVDRLYLYRVESADAAGLYSLSVKLAAVVVFTVRAFQYAWPPLAYSIDDDAEAARLYSFVTTYYVLGTGVIVAALALLGRWVVRLFAAPAFFAAHEALPWVALGWALYGLFLVLVVAGRAQVTTRASRPRGRCRQRRAAGRPLTTARDQTNMLMQLVIVSPSMYFLTARLFRSVQWGRAGVDVISCGRGRQPLPGGGRGFIFPRRLDGAHPRGPVGRGLPHARGARAPARPGRAHRPPAAGQPAGVRSGCLTPVRGGARTDSYGPYRKERHGSCYGRLPSLAERQQLLADDRRRGGRSRRRRSPARGLGPTATRMRHETGSARVPRAGGPVLQRRPRAGGVALLARALAAAVVPRAGGRRGCSPAPPRAGPRPGRGAASR